MTANGLNKGDAMNENLFKFMEMTGVFTEFHGFGWRINFEHSFCTFVFSDWCRREKTVFKTPTKALQAAMQHVQSFKPAWPKSNAGHEIFDSIYERG